MLSIVLAGISAVIWLYLMTGRGLFWLGRVRDDTVPAVPAAWPSVAVVIPARNEAAVIAESVGSMLRQDYAGALSVTVVDDESDDGTGALAKAAAEGSGRAVRVIESRNLPAGWTGKLWAVSQGVAEAERVAAPDYLLLTDADIVHAPDTLSWLVAHAAEHKYVLTSFMAKLRCDSLAERSHVPAFIYFFEMLYPFAWVRRP